MVITNPHPGRGRAGAGLRGLGRALREAGLGYRIVRTAGASHATERDALRGGERHLVAAGAVQEAVNGMLGGGRPVANAVLGVVAPEREPWMMG